MVKLGLQGTGLKNQDQKEGVPLMSMDERELLCNERCKFQREGRCMLERLDFLSPVHGAVCCDHLWEDEAQVHD